MHWCLEISAPGFTSLGYTVDTWGRTAVCYGGGPVHSGIFSSIPGFPPTTC